MQCSLLNSLGIKMVPQYASYGSAGVPVVLATIFMSDTSAKFYLMLIFSSVGLLFLLWTINYGHHLQGIGEYCMNIQVEHFSEGHNPCSH